jgi:four helix bundle protein
VLLRGRVGARRLEELVVWQLANELRHKVYEITASGPAANDFRFRDQIRDATSSVARNIAEGFGRYRHREFAQFLVIARGSLLEIIDHLHDGAARKHWDEEATTELHALCNRTLAAITRFIHHLRRTPDL